MRTQVVVVGASGHAKVVCDALLLGGLAVGDLLGLVDDDPHLWRESLLGFPVLGPLDMLNRAGDVRLAMGIGDNEARERLFERAKTLEYSFVNAVHPAAVISPHSRLGAGLAVFANVVVNAGTRIGDNVILNTACSVDHDCDIGSHVHIAPGVRVAGRVRVGERAFVGIGATVLPGLSIGARAIIAAGAVVVCDVPCDCTAVGVPARIRQQYTLKSGV